MISVLVPFHPDFDLGLRSAHGRIHPFSCRPLSSTSAFSVAFEARDLTLTIFRSLRAARRKRSQLRVDIVEAAVSTSNGDIAFEAGHGCGSSVCESLTSAPTAIPVKAIDLRSFVSQRHARSLLIKLDVEGAEEFPVLPPIAHGVLADKRCCFLRRTMVNGPGNCY